MRGWLIQPRMIVCSCAGGRSLEFVLHWQGSLFDTLDDAEPAVDATFAGIERHPLDARSWVDHLPGWVRGSSGLMARLADNAPWQPQRTVYLYDHLVPEPRLVARWESLGSLPPVVAQMRSLLSTRYGVDFDSVGVNLYRDGRDSVAWHGDRVAKVMAEPLVVTVSLGERRRFHLRPASGGPVARTFLLGEGDLLVMGGRCQHDWRHAVPKVAGAGSRMSITFRQSRAASWRAIVD